VINTVVPKGFFILSVKTRLPNVCLRLKTGVGDREDLRLKQRDIMQI